MQTSQESNQAPVTTPLNKKQRAAAKRALCTPISPIETPFGAPVTSEVAKQNLAKQQAREFANVTHAAQGLLVIINNEDGTVTYGFEDLQVWVPRTQSWDLLTANNPDKFMVTAETHALASSEFYNRWRTFCQIVYQTRIFIEAINR